LADLLLIGGAPRELIEALSALVGRGGGMVRQEESGLSGLESHRDTGAEVVLVCLPLDGISGDEVLERLIDQDPRAVVVVCGRDPAITGSADALDRGAFQHVVGIGAQAQILAAVGLALGARQADAQLSYLRSRDASGTDWESIVGQCPPMRSAFATVRKICRRTVGGGAPAVLITGETGTGKGLFAKALHYNSVRRSWALVELNCAAVPATLIEAELFGHERGAFTDARSARAGLFETADRGTLFLDEIAALDLSLQAKLLNAIEEKRVRRLGGSNERPVDVQIVAATAQDLEAMSGENRFRADLFHRLDVVRIHLPPLRTRGDDRVLLAETFLRQICYEYGLPEKQLSDGARLAVERYDWPGNVRELHNRIERAVLLKDDVMVRTADLELPELERRVEIETSKSGLKVSLPEQGLKFDDLEREVLRQALERQGGNVSRAARFLGITRQTLIYRMRKHGL